MKKLGIFSIVLCCIFLFGCNNNDANKSQREIKNEFSMKQECAKYKDTWESKAADSWNDYDAYVSCETKTYYSNNLNTCIGESECSAGGMRFYNLVDLLENTQLFSCSEVDDECSESFEEAHSKYN